MSGFQANPVGLFFYKPLSLAITIVAMNSLDGERGKGDFTEMLPIRELFVKIG